MITQYLERTGEHMLERVHHELPSTY